MALRTWKRGGMDVRQLARKGWARRAGNRRAQRCSGGLLATGWAAPPGGQPSVGDHGPGEADADEGEEEKGCEGEEDFDHGASVHLAGGVVHK